MDGDFRIYNASSLIGHVKLSLDIDSKSDVIKGAHFDLLTNKAEKYQAEMSELVTLITHRKLSDCRKIKRSHFQFETKNKEGHFFLRPLGLTLLFSAIEDYLGEDHCIKENNQTICSCFNVSIKDITSRVLHDKNYDIGMLVKETMATSGCSTCLNPIKALIEKTRDEYGLIKGLDNSRSRFDANGNWIKVAGLYPGELLIKLEDLKNDWLVANELDDKLEIEFTDIEGLHLTVKMDVSDDFKKKLFIEALSDYFKEKLGILFFIHG